MREIEFRGKRKDNGKWLYGNYVHCDKFINEHGEVKKPFHTIIPITFIDEVVFEQNLQGKDFDVIPETVGQYTGLKDKKGNKIFVSDIVRILSSEWASKDQDDPRSLEQYLIDIACIGYIDFEYDRFGVCVKNKWNDDILMSLYIGDHGYIQVIGNKHDNPELLEATNG